MAASQSPQESRSLPERPDLQQLKKQAKELLKGYRAGDSAAVAEVETYEQEPNPAEFALNDSQRVLARAYGFASWGKLVDRVNGATVERFCIAAENGDLPALTSMVATRPELVGMERAGNDEHVALHYAVLNRDVDCTRLLLEAGSDPHHGIYPHRDATTPLVLAQDRGFEDIVELIGSELDRRRLRLGATRSDVDLVAAAIRDDDLEELQRLLEAEPERATAVDGSGNKPLHHAARAQNERLTAYILELDDELSVPNSEGMTPVDCAITFGWTKRKNRQAAEAVVRLLLQHGAQHTARSAAALGEIAFLQSMRHEELEIYENDAGGLLTIAVRFGQEKVLKLLLDAGIDPDERKRKTNLDEETYSWGFPLWHAAYYSEYEMAEALIAAGADVNAMVYASGPPMERAYDARDEKMKSLLRRHGALTYVEIIGLNRDTTAAREIIEGRATAYTDRTETTPMEQLLWAAACGGDPEIVAMCLPHIDRALTDPWWSNILEQPLRIWNHGSHRVGVEFDRSTYPRCLELLLDHGVDPNVTDHHNYTALHDLAHGSCSSPRVMTDQEELAFGHLLLDAGASLTMRDPLLKSTPLGWACRNGRRGLVELMIEQGAAVDEPDADEWATPLAWATKMGHEEIVTLLRERGARV